MYKYYLNFFCLTFIYLLFYGLDCKAQIFTQTVRGKVIDMDSKSPLVGVSVVVMNTDSFIAAASDVDGKYRLENVPLGRYSIKARCLGFEEMVLNNIIVTSGKEVILTIEMREKVYTTDAIEVVYEKDKTKANNDLVTNSARNFQREETERYAGSRGDPSKMAANFAGVATGNDARNDIVVRGNSPLGVLWRLEGTDIPNPNHFSTQGATGGAVSILNNNLLSNSDFLTGAFPSEYGNKLAAVFDLKLRNGNNEKLEGTGQFGFNGIELGLEGPIAKKNGSSFLANYRYSTLEVFQLMGINFGVSGLPKYQDFSFKLNLPTSDKGIFTLWGIGGLSHIELLDSKKNAKDWSFTKQGEDLVFTSGMGAVGCSHTCFFNNKISGKFNFSVSANEYIIKIDTLNSSGRPFLVYQNKSLDYQSHLNYTLTNKINAHHLIKAGITHGNLFFDYNSTYYSRSTQEYRNQLKEKNNAALIQSFIHWQYRLSDAVTINSGVYYQVFVLNNSQAIEPRTGIKWQFLPKQSLTFGYGMHSQMQPLVYYFFYTYDDNTQTFSQTNRDLDLSKSAHFVGGYDFNFAKNFRLKVESYYQHLYDVPIEKFSSAFSMINVGNNLDGIPLVGNLTNKGTGKNYGVEFTLEKFFDKNYYFLVTTTLYESRYKGSDNIDRFSAFSGGYVCNALTGFEFKLGHGNKTMALDVKVTIAGGNRYTPVDIEASEIANAAVYQNQFAYSEKYKDYSKIDFKMSFKFNRKKITESFFVNIENIFNTKNILREVYNPDKKETISEYQLGLFPYGGYRIEF